VKVARVVGNVVSTIQSEIFDGRKLLLCDLLDASGEPDGNHLIAVDTVGAGAGELVILIDEGTSARQILDLTAGPVRTVVVGIVDDITDDGTWRPTFGPVGTS
jgi:ethanolamine utilization protein EutN